MSPEYAMEGHFSIKSDVFSFGVLLLEIISGRRNSSTFDDEKTVNLVGHVSLLIVVLTYTKNVLQNLIAAAKYNECNAYYVGLGSVARR